jgi:predicted metalloprotease
MKWQGRRQSENVEDRRGMPMGRVALGGGATIVIVVVAMLFGADPRVILKQLQGLDTSQPSTQQGAADPKQDELAAFASTILADTEDVWKAEFAKMGQQYVEPHLVLFSDQVESACGLAGAAAGPFYCPGDSKLYLDLSFFAVMDRQLGAPGDFAQAYVIAHEVGHHVQNLLGISERVSRMRETLSEAEANDLSVRVELQADFLAGMWAHDSQKMRSILEPGDMEEALNAASAIGDDTLQRQTQGQVVPDSFTHGTSAQRVRWFRKGYETGDFSQGDTFRERNL